MYISNSIMKIIFDFVKAKKKYIWHLLNKAGTL